MSIHSSIQETSSNPLELTHSDVSDSSDTRKSLTDLFQQIFSADQMDVCQKHGLLSKKEQQEAQKMAKTLVHQHQLPATSQEWKNLTEWVIMLRDRYSDRLEKQSIRTYKSDRERIDRLDKIQKLSEHLEVYGQSHDDLTDLLPALKKLRNDWKNRTKDVESIIKSILSSMTLEKARVVTIGRAQLIQLGLGLKSLGKSYLVFEAGATQEAERQEVIHRIARDFSSVFEENASQNLARMAGSYRRVFQPEADNVIDEIQQLSQDIYIGRPKSPPIEQPQSALKQEGKDPVPVERRQSTANICNSDIENGLTFPFNVTKPVFEPTSRDWPHVLKYKDEGIWSTSISRLSKHFTKIGHVYYSSMLNNAKLIHVHQTQLFDFASKSLIRCYAAIQLEQGCSNLGRALVYLYRLEQDQNSI
ncbi:hypothetical protein K501DRAFT_247507 [Backusella circina FSU 941]|nr:hypothetical protein K501DRAFT_247507 [Backusella circina FSU 941]